MNRLLPVGLFTAILTGIPVKAADPACQPVIEAVNKGDTVPVHLYMTETAQFLQGKTRSSEAVYLEKASYIEVNGRWVTSPITRQSLAAERKKTAQDSNTTCKRAGEEAVNGEPAVIYTSHQQTQDEKVDTRMWISKSRNLPLKSETDMDVGGSMWKSHQTVRYEYTNVQPPPGVH